MHMFYLFLVGVLTGLLLMVSVIALANYQLRVNRSSLLDKKILRYSKTKVVKKKVIDENRKRK